MLLEEMIGNHTRIHNQIRIRRSVRVSLKYIKLYSFPGKAWIDSMCPPISCAFVAGTLQLVLVYFGTDIPSLFIHFHISGYKEKLDHSRLRKLCVFLTRKCVHMLLCICGIQPTTAWLAYSNFVIPFMTTRNMLQILYMRSQLT
ncbi:hypothetical protein GQX74_004073 [Glossina fuscipes]|nr:hypothetical protein GQX74_004073 [Glossina fuscipes]